MLFGFFAGISLMEAALMHLVLARWSSSLAWTLTGLSVYGAVWLVAVARSFALRPVLATDTELVVRAGLLWTVRVPRCSISCEDPGAICEIRLTPLGNPNVVLRLADPVRARGLYGRTRSVHALALSLDEPEAFRRAIRS